MKKLFIILVTIVLSLAVLFENHSNPVVGAHGGRNDECNNADDIDPINDNLATYTAPSGQIVSGVCIKAGNDMFSDGHSDALGNGTYNGTSGLPCYTVAGVGTQTVIVTRIASGNTCKGISHIDVYTSVVPTNTPTPTPTNTPTPTPTVTNTPTPTVTTTPTVTPTVTDTPTPTPTTGGQGGQGGNQPTPTDTTTPTPTTTSTPSTGVGGPGDGLSDGKSDGKSSTPSTTTPKGEVLGASTFAPTGGFLNGLMNLMLASGILTLGAGIKRYAKESK